jgi:hypothetical protein
MLRKFILMPLCGLIAKNVEVFVFVVGTAIMLGLQFIYIAYGRDAAIAAVIIVVILGMWANLRSPVYVPDMSQPGEPMALPGDGPPSLPGPAAQARLGSVGTRRISAPPVGTSPAVSGRGCNDSHRVPVGHR